MTIITPNKVSRTLGTVAFDTEIAGIEGPLRPLPPLHKGTRGEHAVGDRRRQTLSHLDIASHSPTCRRWLRTADSCNAFYPLNAKTVSKCARTNRNKNTNRQKNLCQIIALDLGAWYSSVWRNSSVFQPKAMLINPGNVAGCRNIGFPGATWMRLADPKRRTDA